MNILKQEETYEALLNSLFIASGVTVMSTIIGTFFAWLVTRTDLPYKGFMKVMFLVPFYASFFHWSISLENVTFTTFWLH